MYWGGNRAASWSIKEVKIFTRLFLSVDKFNGYHFNKLNVKNNQYGDIGTPMQPSVNISRSY